MVFYPRPTQPGHPPLVGEIRTSDQSIFFIISYHIVVRKWQNHLRVGTDKPWTIFETSCSAMGGDGDQSPAVL